MQPKIVVLFILRTTEHLEFSLILQKQPSTMWSPHCILIFGTVLKEKRLKTVQKRLFSKSPKIGNRKKQMSILPFWEEVGVKKWSQFLDFGHSKSCIWTWAVPLGTFSQNYQKCPSSGAQKWELEHLNPKTETTFSRQHPPKMLE